MAREAEAEAHFRKNRQVICNQQLIQFFAVLAIAVPLPLTGIVFWAMFGLSSPLAVQSVAAFWAVAATTYFGMNLYVKIKQRKP